MVKTLAIREDLHILRMVLGPAYTNAYLLGDPAGDTAVVIDPAWSGDVILAAAEERGWRISAIWLTHAHFDHFGGAAAIVDHSSIPVPVALHPKDQPLWRANGGARVFGIPSFDPGPEPTLPLEHSTQLHVGRYPVEVAHTPGHTPGHVMFVLPGPSLCFSGDLIFQGSVGRTDLPGGDWDTLLRSIQTEVLPLADDMQLLPGHGPSTTVGQERRANPFIRSDIHF